MKRALFAARGALATAVEVTSAAVPPDAFGGLLASLIALAWVVEARDPYTGGHLWRVSSYARLLAEAAELPSSDDGIPLRSCPTCGPTLVIRREDAAGDSVVCPNCASVFDLVQDDAEFSTRFTGRHGSALDLAPVPDELLIGRLVTSAVRALPESAMERLWRWGPS